MTKEAGNLKPKKKKTLSRKQEGFLYIGSAAFLATMAIVLLSVLVPRVQRQRALEAQWNALQEQYEDLAREHENLSDPDYANVYYDANNVHVPSEDVIWQDTGK